MSKKYLHKKKMKCLIMNGKNNKKKSKNKSKNWKNLAKS